MRIPSTERSDVFDTSTGDIAAISGAINLPSIPRRLRRSATIRGSRSGKVFTSRAGSTIGSSDTAETSTRSGWRLRTNRLTYQSPRAVLERSDSDPVSGNDAASRLVRRRMTISDRKIGTSRDEPGQLARCASRNKRANQEASGTSRYNRSASCDARPTSPD